MSQLHGNSIVPGSYVYGRGGLGRTGAEILANTATGGSGPGYLYGCVDPGDEAKEFQGVPAVYPTAGTFYQYGDGSFSFTSAPDGRYTMTFPLKVDGVFVANKTVVLWVGPITMDPVAGHLAFTGYAPTIVQTTGGAQVLTPGSGHLAFTGYAPAVTQSANQALDPITGHLTFTGKQPTIAQTANLALAPGKGSLVFTGYQPVIIQGGGQVLLPGSGHLTFQGYQPTVTQTANLALTPVTGHLAFTGYQPTVTQSGSSVLSPTTGHLTFTGKQPTIVQTTNTDRVLTPGAGHLTFTGYRPIVRQQSAGGLPEEVTASRIYVIPADTALTPCELSFPTKRIWEKDPDATLDYGFDWRVWEASLPDDEIIDYNLRTTLDLVITAQGMVQGIYCAVVSGGFDGAQCEVICRVETVQGRIDERTIILVIRQR